MMGIYTDIQLLKQHYPQTNLRIVSLVPSISLLLYSLGLEEEVVGITKFCIHPPQWLNHKPRIGGTKNIQVEAIKALQPSLVIASKEENVETQVKTISQFVPIWLTDVSTLKDALDLIINMGQLTNTSYLANSMATKIANDLALLPKPLHPLKVAYLIWKDPYMAVGSDTFISSMLTEAGFNNYFNHLTRYPVIEPTALTGADCIFLSSEPYPFRAKHQKALAESTGISTDKIILVDGEIFSWYGSRLLDAYNYFIKLLSVILAKE
jgi:ABC-type Fe3+-hydroxamate transport system substrate-binding protein